MYGTPAVPILCDNMYGQQGVGGVVILAELAECLAHITPSNLRYMCINFTNEQTYRG